MGSLLLAAGTQVHVDYQWWFTTESLLQGMRHSLPNSRIMVHQPSGGASGQATDILIQVITSLVLISLSYVACRQRRSPSWRNSWMRSMWSTLARLWSTFTSHWRETSSWIHQKLWSLVWLIRFWNTLLNLAALLMQVKKRRIKQILKMSLFSSTNLLKVISELHWFQRSHHTRWYQMVWSDHDSWSQVVCSQFCCLSSDQSSASSPAWPAPVINPGHQPSSSLQ